MERIKDAFNVASYKGIPVSVSMGWATKERMQDDMMGVLKQAEDMMYENKLYTYTKRREMVVKEILSEEVKSEGL